MKKFLEKYNLYQEYLLLEGYTLGNQNYTNKTDFRGENFDYLCQREGKIRPFELYLPDSISDKIIHPQGIEKIHDKQFIDEKLNYTFWAAGKCKSCENFDVHFLLNVFSNKPISNLLNNIDNINLSERNRHNFTETNIYIKKVGCSPENKVFVEKEISKHFDQETNNWLYKAKSLKNLNYGIGAFAYYRRIIEKELIKIIEEIKALPDSDENKIGQLLKDFEDNPKTYTIYENIFQYLPNSLKGLGDNVIQLLYKQTSEGLHSLKEKDCLERAESIDLLLDFTIRKINEEKSEIKSVKDAIKKLK